MRDFENFKSEYIKLAATKRVMLIFITIKKKEKLINTKQKKKVLDLLLFYYILKKINDIYFLIRNPIQMMMRLVMMMNQFQIFVTKIKFLKYQIFLYLIKELQKMLQNCERKLGVLYITGIV